MKAQFIDEKPNGVIGAFGTGVLVQTDQGARLSGGTRHDLIGARE